MEADVVPPKLTVVTHQVKRLIAKKNWSSD
jgi:hypothetical protein